MVSSVSASSAEEPLVLDLAMGLALAQKNNELLLQAHIDLIRSREEIRAARSAGLPQLAASVNYDRNWLLPSFIFAGNAVRIGSENNINGRISMRQTLYAGGGISAAKDIARRQFAMSGETERATQQLVIATVVERFYELLLAHELVKVAQLSSEQARRNLVQVQARRRAGRASEFDQLRAQVQVSSMRADSIRAENDKRLAEMALKDAVGLPLDQPLEVRGSFRTETSLDLADLDALLERSLSRRPELERVAHQIKLQERTIAAEQAASRPSLEAVAIGQSQFQSDEFDVGDKEWRKSWNTGLVLQVPLFDGQRTGARVAQARQDLRWVKYERQRLEREVRLQIQQAWYDAQEASERIEVNRDAVLQAEKGMQIAESRYANGVSTQLEILDAQLALVRAQTERATARRDRALSLMRLEMAVGVLGE